MDNESLENSRRKKADKAFENADLEGIEDFNGWTLDGNFWSRTVFWADKDGDSILGSFGVRFAPNSDLIIDSWKQ